MILYKKEGFERNRGLKTADYQILNVYIITPVATGLLEDPGPSGVGKTCQFLS